MRYILAILLIFFVASDLTLATVVAQHDERVTCDQDPDRPQKLAKKISKHLKPLSASRIKKVRADTKQSACTSPVPPIPPRTAKQDFLLLNPPGPVAPASTPTPSIGAADTAPGTLSVPWVWWGTPYVFVAPAWQAIDSGSMKPVVVDGTRAWGIAAEPATGNVPLPGTLLLISSVLAAPVALSILPVIRSRKERS